MTFKGSIAGVLEYMDTLMDKLRSITSVQDARKLAYLVINDACAVLLKHAEESRQEVSDSFWLSQTLLYIYSVIALAAFFQRWWILHGISLILLEKIVVVIAKWTAYTLDDRALAFARKYIQGWLDLFLREGEKILSGEAAMKFALSYTVISQVPTGYSYLKYYIRYKSKLLREDFLSEVGGNRFKTLRESAFSSVKLPALPSVRLSNVVPPVGNRLNKASE